MKAKVKITVLKRTLHKELLEKYAESIWESRPDRQKGEKKGER